jgi:hypothetical protein
MANASLLHFQRPMNRGKNLPLSYWLPVYGCSSSEGYKNFSTWIS